MDYLAGTRSARLNTQEMPRLSKNLKHIRLSNLLFLIFFTIFSSCTLFVFFFLSEDGEKLFFCDNFLTEKRNYDLL